MPSLRLTNYLLPLDDVEVAGIHVRHAHQLDGEVEAAIAVVVEGCKGVAAKDADRHISQNRVIGQGRACPREEGGVVGQACCLEGELILLHPLRCRSG